MTPLLKNDLRWAGPLGIAGLIIGLLSLGSHSAVANWATPTVLAGATTLAFAGIAALVLGLVAALVEDVTRTREYLLHRPVSVARLFWTRHALGLGIVTAWIVLVPLLDLGWSHLFSANAALLDDSRLPMTVGLALPAWLFYALGVWMASVSRTRIGGLALVIVVGIPLFAAVLAGVLLTSTAVGAGFVVACVVLTPVLLAAALAAVRAGRDPDRPWSATRLRQAGPAAALIAILAGGMLATMLETAATGGLLSLYPKAAAVDGRPVLYRWSAWDVEYQEVDQRHRMGAVVERPPSPWLFEPENDAWDVEDSGSSHIGGFPHRGWPFRGVVYGRPFMGPSTNRLAIPGSDGFIHLIKLATRDGVGADRPVQRHLGKGPQNLPFSGKTKWVRGSWDQVAALYDPADGGLWIYHLASGAPSFHRVDLPGGDRFVASDWLKQFPPQAFGFPAPLSPLFVWGQRGRYALNQQGQFQLAAPDDNAIPVPGWNDQVTLHAPTRFTATVTSDDGKLLFRHEYRPYTLAERATAALIYAPALLRPPVTSLASLLTPERRAWDMGRLILDPAVARAGHWLVAANAIVALALALLAWRRLGRLGVTGGRRRFWVAVVLAGGLPGYVCQRLVETRRAWQPLPAAEKAAIPVLLMPDLPAVHPV